MMRTAFRAVALTAALLLAGCQNGQQNASEDMKKDLDQLVQTSKDMTAPVKEIAAGSKASTDALKALGAKLDEMHKDLAKALAQQKRGALYLALDVETLCENDEQCTNTARAVCNKINYPNAVTSRFTPGLRPVLNSVVCFD